MADSDWEWVIWGFRPLTVGGEAMLLLLVDMVTVVELVTEQIRGVLTG